MSNTSYSLIVMYVSIQFKKNDTYFIFFVTVVSLEW